MFVFQERRGTDFLSSKVTKESVGLMRRFPTEFLATLETQKNVLPNFI